MRMRRNFWGFELNWCLYVHISCIYAGLLKLVKSGAHTHIKSYIRLYDTLCTNTHNFEWCDYAAQGTYRSSQKTKIFAEFFLFFSFFWFLVLIRRALLASQWCKVIIGHQNAETTSQLRLMLCIGMWQGCTRWTTTSQTTPFHHSGPCIQTLKRIRANPSAVYVHISAKCLLGSSLSSLLVWVSSSSSESSRKLTKPGMLFTSEAVSKVNGVDSKHILNNRP